MNSTAIAFVLGGAFVGALGIAVDQLSLPVVSIDALTGQCVRIESPAGDLPCTNIPDRYVRQSVYRPTDFYRDSAALNVAGTQL